jgi:hypothetical protein
MLLFAAAYAALPCSLMVLMILCETSRRLRRRG